MTSPDPAFVAASRRRDLLLTGVMVCIGLTPAWFLPDPWSQLWLAVGLVLGAPAVVLSWRHAPWVPTPAEELPRILHHLALKPGQRFCDLGAGDGRMVQRVRAATGAHCVGVEAGPLPFLAGWLRLRRTAGTEIRFGDLYTADLSVCDAVYVWGTAYSVGTPRFGDRMRETLKPGARLVSYHQPVYGLEPNEVDEGGMRPIYVYVVR